MYSRSFNGITFSCFEKTTKYQAAVSDYGVLKDSTTAALYRTQKNWKSWSEIEGQRSSGLYAAAGNDKALEKAVHDISATVYGARPGILRMPLKCPTSKLAKDRPPMLSRKESIDDNLPWEVYEPLKTTIETTTTRYPTDFDAPKRNARELVQQEIYRADSKRKGIADRPTQVGGYHIQRETLKPHGDGMQLDHIDKRIYGEVKPGKHTKKQTESSGKHCMPFKEQ
jgi:hypothetical protein